MCLAVPARIVEIEGQLATVQIGGVNKQASLVLLPDAVMGDYVLIHAGFAISVVDEEEAQATLELFEDLLKGMGGGALED